MFYQFELMMAGIILLSAMTVCGITMWLRRRNEPDKTELPKDSEQENI